ncbi:hypothetical protein, partial [Holdemania massiliensis]
KISIKKETITKYCFLQIIPLNSRPLNCPLNFSPLNILDTHEEPAKNAGSFFVGDRGLCH